MSFPNLYGGKPMTEKKVKRKLTAIFSADVEGYSRLMGEDELKTIDTLTSHKEVMVKLIREYRGRVVDSTGDNLLAEFASVVDAVQCAVEVQQILSQKNETLPENRRMHFRIGINLGDVVEEGERIYGDGVNIAARVETLAKGGGISLSGTAYDQLGKKLPLGYEYVGEQTVKNIAKPVRVYRILTETEAAGKVIGEKQTIAISRRWAALTVAVIIVLAGVFAVWQFYLRPDFEPASVEKMALPLPKNPSLAILPFDNMSGDPKQDYLSDGITESLISSVSKIPHLFVIARNSTFTYKGKAVKVQQVAQELGVQYVLEGSVQRSDNRLRITAQLVDAIKGNHLWSEKYDRNLNDLFQLQDEVIKEIVTALNVELTQGEQARLAAKGTDNLEAYLKFIQARENVYRHNIESNASAQQLAQEAIDLDPNYASAYRVLGATHMHDILLGRSKSPKESLVKAIELVKKAIKLDDQNGYSHATLGFLLVMIRQYDKAVAEAERGVALDPNVADIYGWLGIIYRYVGRWEDAITAYEKAIRLNPMPPNFYLQGLGLAYTWTGRYEEGIRELKRAVQNEPDSPYGHLFAAAAYSMAGRDEAARREADEVLRLNPNFTLERWAKSLKYKNQDDQDRLMSALRKAGLPDQSPLPLPNKPSIAVLPFTNMSDDPKQDFFSDGLTEEIITALSKAPQLFVIASNTSFTYKGKPVKVKTLGKELGVQYVIEGSVRREGERVRITAQMIDALNDRHLWAERYDKEFKDIFSIQDDITKKIITAVHAKLTEGERARVFAKGTFNLQAYLRCMQADWFVNQATKDSVLRAEKLAEEAIASDPNYAYPHMVLGTVQIYYLFLGMSQSPRDTLMLAIKQYKKAVALNPKSGEAHALLAYGLVMARQYDKAAAECERAMVLESNSYKTLYHCASALTFIGRREEAIPMFREALRINPKPPNSLYRHFGIALRDSEQYGEAIEISKKATERKPNDLLAHVVLASSYGLAGREEEAKAAAKEILRINPTYSVDRLEKVSPHKDRGVAKRFCDALRRAGLK
jgi:adenylate cyclase